MKNVFKLKDTELISDFWSSMNINNSVESLVLQSLRKSQKVSSQPIFSPTRPQPSFTPRAGESITKTDRDQERAGGWVCWSHFLIMHIKAKAFWQIQVSVKRNYSARKQRTWARRDAVINFIRTFATRPFPFIPPPSFFVTLIYFWHRT